MVKGTMVAMLWTLEPQCQEFMREWVMDLRSGTRTGETKFLPPFMISRGIPYQGALNDYLYFIDNFICSHDGRCDSRSFVLR